MNNICDIREIEHIVVDELPLGLVLDKVQLTFAGLAPGHKPNFVVVIEVLISEPRFETDGWCNRIQQRVRAKYSPDDLYISINIRDKD